MVERVRRLLLECLSAVVLPENADADALYLAEISRGMRVHNWNEKAEAFQMAAACALAAGRAEDTGTDPEAIPAAARYPLALWAFNKSAALSRPVPREAELHYLAYFWLTSEDPEVAARTAPTYPHGLKYYFSLASVEPGASYVAPLRTDAPIDVLRRLALHPRPEVPRELRRMLVNLGQVSPRTLEELRTAARTRNDLTPAQREAVLGLLEPTGDRLAEMRCLLDEAARIARVGPVQAIGLVQRACGLLDGKDTPESEELLRELTRGASRVGDIGLAGRALVQVYLAAEKIRPGEEMLAEAALIQRLHEEIRRAGGGSDSAIGRFLADHPTMHEDLQLDEIPPDCHVSPEAAAREHAQGVAYGPNNEQAAQCFRRAVAIAAAAPGASLEDFKHYVASFYASSARLNFRRGHWEKSERCYLVFFNLLYGDEVLRARIAPIIVPVLKYYLSLSFRARRTVAHISVDRETSPQQLIERIRATGGREVCAALDDLLAKLEQANPLVAQDLKAPDRRRHVILTDSTHPPSPADARACPIDS